MRRFIAPVLSLLLASTVHAAPASPQSVERLLQLTKSEAIMDSMYVGMEQMMRQGMQQSTQGKPVSPEQQRMMDAMPAKFMVVMRDEMNWAKLKPLYVQLYVDTFEQEEVDGMISFYQSPIGQAALNKMPVVMQKSMALSQTLMQSLMPKMQKAVADAMAEAKLTK